MVFKEATTNDQMAKLHRLNHQTFAEELKQYERNETGVLIDRFHAKNRYFIAIEEGCVCGMQAKDERRGDASAWASADGAFGA